MEPWNIVVTRRRNGERTALKELKSVGRFSETGFRDVLFGSVEARSLVL